MPTSYTWEISVTQLTGTAPSPGPYVPQPPAYGSGDPRKVQFERGIKFANVPGGRADFVVHGGPRVQHVNSVANILQTPGDTLSKTGTYSGDVKFRFRSYRRFPVPDSVSKIEFRSSNRYTDPIFPFTGQYPPDHQFFVLGSGTVVMQGDMPYGMSRYAAGNLPDFRVIVAGGFLSSSVGFQALSGAHTYFSGTGAWTALPDMPSAKIYPAGVVLSGTGDFFVIGGSSGSGWDPVEGVRAYRYVHASGAWFPTATDASVPRSDFEVVQIADGRVFIPGGLNVAFTGSELWDPSTNQFSATLPIPLEPYNREAYTTTLLSDNSVMVCGGWDPMDRKPLRHAFRFYPSLMSWSIEPSMSFGHAGHQASFIDGKLLVMGGYDPDEITTFPFPFPGPPAGQGSEYSSFAATEIYDFNTRVWTTTTPMPVPRARFGSFAYNRDGGRVIVFGGHDKFVPTKEVDVFIFETEQWLAVAPLASGVFDIKAVALEPNNAFNNFKILIPGGILTGSSPMFSGSQLYNTSG